jgi:hypothetical protein
MKVVALKAAFVSARNEMGKQARMALPALGELPVTNNK